jgi:hypothetical protein
MRSWDAGTHPNGSASDEEKQDRWTLSESSEDPETRFEDLNEEGANKK